MKINVINKKWIWKFYLVGPTALKLKEAFHLPKNDFTRQKHMSKTNIYETINFYQSIRIIKYIYQKCLKT